MTWTRDQIVATAREALGTPWIHQGRSVPYGLDCVGLLLWTCRKLSITEYEPPPYPKNAQWNQFIGYFRQNLEEIRWQDAKRGDVLCFRQHIYPCHCGIITEDGADPKFIHSFLRRRKVVEERLSDYWKPVIVAAFHIPGVE